MPDTFGMRLFVSYIFLIFGGWLGIHRFALRYPWSGVVYALTGGVMGFGIFIDIFLLPYMVRLSLIEEN